MDTVTPTDTTSTGYDAEPAEDCGPQDVPLGSGCIAYLYCANPVGHEGKHTP